MGSFIRVHLGDSCMSRTRAERIIEVTVLANIARSAAVVVSARAVAGHHVAYVVQSTQRVAAAG